MDVAGVLEVILLVVILAALPLLWIFARRRLLARQGGMFECGLRLKKATPSDGWVLGVARYSGEYLEWFPAFGLGLNPRLRFRRSATAALESRHPDHDEAGLLYQGQRIVSIESNGARRHSEKWDLAMADESVTGLLSWLEAAPPSVDRFRA